MWYCLFENYYYELTISMKINFELKYISEKTDLARLRKWWEIDKSLSRLLFKKKKLIPAELGGSDHFGHVKIHNDKTVNRKKYMGVLAKNKI